jgi:hypothetical protein
VMIDERMLAIGRRVPLVFRVDDPFDRRKVALAQCVVLLALGTFRPSIVKIL